MALTLSEKAWLLAERLYIHSYSADKFLALLNECEIEYTAELANLYASLNTHPNLYVFMSEPNYTFAEFMKSVPSYKYIPLLEKIVFEANVEKTQRNDWNYYGEKIKLWYPELVNLLSLASINIDRANKKLEYQEEFHVVSQGDFLPSDLRDMFLDYIRKEINECYINGQYLSVMFLSRKILEVIVIRVFEVVFPKIVNHQYSEANHKLWYDSRHARYHDFEVLLGNLKNNAIAFQEDKDMIIQLVESIKPLKNATNECVHRDYRIPDIDYISQWKIPYVISLGTRVFRKYCRP
jgi:hypothetical protein